MSHDEKTKNIRVFRALHFISNRSRSNEADLPFVFVDYYGKVLSNEAVDFNNSDPF